MLCAVCVLLHHSYLMLMARDHRKNPERHILRNATVRFGVYVKADFVCRFLTTYNSEHIKTNDLCNFIVSRMEMGWPCYESGFHFMIGSGYSTLLLLLFIANEKDRKHSNFMPLSLIE